MEEVIDQGDYLVSQVTKRKKYAQQDVINVSGC